MPAERPLFRRTSSRCHPFGNALHSVFLRSIDIFIVNWKYIRFWSVQFPDRYQISFTIRWRINKRLIIDMIECVSKYKGDSLFWHFEVKVYLSCRVSGSVVLSYYQLSIRRSIRCFWNCISVNREHMDSVWLFFCWFLDFFAISIAEISHCKGIKCLLVF